MKRKILASILIFAISLIPFANSIAESDEYYPPVKGIFIDVGAGGDGMSANLGFRYSYFSVALGLVGFANTIPNYSLTPPIGVIINPNQPLPNGFEADSYTGLIVTADAGFHFDYFYPYTVFATVGFFNQQDSVLAKDNSTGVTRGNKYFWRAENSLGLTFGLGGNYQINDYVALGLGYHTKRGVYGQFLYTW